MIASITVSRSDFGRMKPVYDLIPDVAIIVDQAHDNASEVCDSGVDVYTRIPDEATCLMILGDRHEMLHWAHEALIRRIPICHIGGGYRTIGAFDDKIRFALTELADIHCVANEFCASALGADRMGVHITGAPDIDAVRMAPNMPDEVGEPYILLSLHPETHRLHSIEKDLEEVRKALDRYKIVATMPCNDPGNWNVINMLQELRDCILLESVGHTRYINLMRHAKCIIGNSSSGIIEGSYLAKPVVNIGARQKGRWVCGNIACCDWDEYEILRSMDYILYKSMSQYRTYGDGYAAEKIVGVLT